MSSAEKPKLIDSLKQFVHSFRFILLAFAAIAFIAAISLIVLSYLNNSTTLAATKAMENCEELFQNYNSAAEAEKEAKKLELLAALDTLRSKFKNSYQEQKSWLLQGSLYYNLKDWANAILAYDTAAQLKKSATLAATALFNAAVSHEANNDKIKAQEYLQKIVDLYSATSPEIGRALLNLGRLAEADGKNDQALAHYQTLVEKFAQSDFAKVAKDRIVYIKSL